jgi:hypothetical protein
MQEVAKMTFKELIGSRGADVVFKGTGVDAETIATLTDYFELEKLGADADTFIWTWRRALLRSYPVYKSYKDMWTEKLSYKWFYDNQYTNKRIYSGTVDITAAMQGELKRALDSIISGTGESSTSGKNESTRDATGSNKGESTSSGTETSAGNTKTRDFAFMYPESNYSGGTIPYDLDDDPSVEFISTQQDKLNRDNRESSDSRTSSDTGETTSKETATGTAESTAKSSDTQTTDTDITDTTSENKTQGTKTAWTETDESKGADITELARKILDLLPSTNFFAVFADSLQCCFLNVMYFDEVGSWREL